MYSHISLYMIGIILLLTILFFPSRNFRLWVQDKYSTMTDAELDEKVCTTIQHNIHLGYRAVQAMLRSQHHFVQESRIRSSMQRINPAAVAMRLVEYNMTFNMFNKWSIMLWSGALCFKIQISLPIYLLSFLPRNLVALQHSITQFSALLIIPLLPFIAAVLPLFYS